jgi:hypothetical protein
MISNCLTDDGILIQCPNHKFKYIWSYRGRFTSYATCPACRKNVKIANNKIESSQSAQVGGQSQTAMAASAIHTNEGEESPT